LVGKEVSWEMECAVSDRAVTLLKLRYGGDGKSLFTARHSQKINPVTMMVVDKHPDTKPDVTFGDHPDLRSDFIHFDIPERISRADAAKLDDRVTVTARVNEIEIGRYEDEDHKEHFLLYIYLADARLKTDDR